MLVKLNEICHLEGNRYKRVFSIIIDTKKLDMSTSEGKDIYGMLHECLSSLSTIKQVNHNNLLTRELYQGTLWHRDIKNNGWIKQFNPYLADTTEFEKEIYILRTFDVDNPPT